MACLHRWLGFVLAVAAVGLGQSARADNKPEVSWEYRVATKEQILELGKKDLAEGLNKLGREGWELVVVDGSYIFKRPRLTHDKEIADLKLTIAILQGEREQQVERLAWVERMLKKGYVSEAQVAADRARLQEYDLVLQNKRRELGLLAPPLLEPLPPAPTPKEAGPRGK